jgi:hypothetical protein
MQQVIEDAVRSTNYLTLEKFDFVYSRREWTSFMGEPLEGISILPNVEAQKAGLKL